MSIVANGTTLQNVDIGGTNITKVYARQNDTSAYVLVFEKGGVTTMALFFGGNWKMNKVKADIDTFFTTFLAQLELNATKKVVIFPPACYLDYVKSKIPSAYSSMISVGIQNISITDRTSGAFTGQISPEMAADCGCTAAMVGNAECREYLGVTDTICNIQMQRSLAAGLTAWLCVGEPLSIREAGTQEAYVTNQLQTALADVPASYYENGKIVINYEPVWAIGTGKTCSAQQANQMCAYIKNWVTNNVGATQAQQTNVVYGGSVKANNINEILAIGDVQGTLSGGVATNAANFATMINVAGN